MELQLLFQVSTYNTEEIAGQASYQRYQIEGEYDDTGDIAKQSWSPTTITSGPGERDYDRIQVPANPLRHQPLPCRNPIPGIPLDCSKCSRQGYYEQQITRRSRGSSVGCTLDNDMRLQWVKNKEKQSTH
jgi:hypothetical protein